jgi:FkbM family methyltransferase
LLRTLSFITSHPLTRRRPILAVARFLRWQIESRVHAEIEYNWIGGSKLLVRNGMTGATGNLYCGLHEFADMGFLLHLLRPNDLFVDVGANIGSYTILASAVCGANTIAIEPDPTTMAALQRNVTANAVESLVATIEAAIGSIDGIAQFTVGLDTVNHVANGNETNTREVRVRRLDDVLGDHSPSLIKLDVEGFEAEVIAGALDTLRKPSLLAVQTESRADEVIKALTAAGFRERHYDPFVRQFADINRYRSSNALFIRNEDECVERMITAPALEILGNRF